MFRLGVFLAMAACVLFTGCPNSGNSGGGGGVSLTEQQQRAMKIEDPLERAVALVEIAEKQERAKDDWGAQQSLREAQRAADELEAEDDADAYCDLHVQLARTYFKARDPDASEEAMEMVESAVEKIESAPERAEVHVQLSILKKAHKDVEGAKSQLKAAEALVEKVVLPSEQIVLLSRIAQRYEKMELSDDVKRLLDAMVQVAEAQEEPGKRGKVLVEVADAQRELGQREVGLETLGKAVELAHSVEGNKLLQANVLYDAAVGYNSAGNRAKAVELADEAKELVRDNPDGTALVEKIDRFKRG